MRLESQRNFFFSFYCNFFFFVRQINGVFIDTTVLTYNAPAKSSLTGGSSGAAPETITTTVRDYDVDQIKQFIQSTMTSVLIISVMHFQFKFTQPLLMQSIMPIKNLITHKEALIHLWGDAPEAGLARPFVAENPLAAITGMFGGNTDTPADAAVAGTATVSTTDNADKSKKEHKE